MLLCIHFQGIFYLMHRVETILAQQCKTLLQETGCILLVGKTQGCRRKRTWLDIVSFLHFFFQGNFYFVVV